MNLTYTQPDTLPSSRDFGCTASGNLPDVSDPQARIATHLPEHTSLPKKSRKPS